jgi:ribosome assembly protein SQT1
LETGDLTWSFWHFGSNVLFAGCEDGSIYMWKVPSGDCKILTAVGSKCECATLLPDGKRLVAGYENGAVKLFDLKSGQVQHNLYVPTPRSCAVLCIDKCQNQEIVAAGNFRGRIHIFNTKTGKMLHTLQCSPNGGRPDDDEDGNADSVESLAFCTNGNLDLLAAGTVSGHVALWDVASMTERMRLKQDAGLTKLVWDSKMPVFYTGGLDGVVRAIDARTCKVERLMGRHRSEVLDLSVSKDGTKLVSASEDGSTFIFSLDQA